MVVFRRKKLEVYLPVLFHDFLEFVSHLVFEYMKFDIEAFGGDLLHSKIVCGKTVFVVTTLKADVYYAVGVVVVSNHGVLIATASTDREAASVISVNVSYVSFPKMKLFR